MADELKTMDGVNQWPSLQNLAENPRTTLLYNIDYSDYVLSGAYRSGDMKILSNVQYMPVYPVPQSDFINTSLITGSWRDQSYLDYMFNITADPTESIDLKEDLPDLFAQLKQELSEYEANMEKVAFCGSVDNHAARKVFNKTQFIAPWIHDVDFRCPEENDISSVVQNDHQVDIYCLYGLLPDEECAS